MTQAESVPSRVRHAAKGAPLEPLARLGYAVSGLLHLLIGWIAVQLAVGSSGDTADQSGALARMTEAPGGRLLLWVAVVGFVALGLWQAVEALFGGRRVEAAKQAAARGKSAGKALMYLALAVTAYSFARGSGTSSSRQSADLSAELMSSTAGRVLLVLIGAAIVGVGAYHVYKGWSHLFTRDLTGTGGGELRRAVVWLGTIGYVAKGLVLAVVGVLFGVAAVRTDPDKATGLDGALRTLGEQPAGTALLVAVGAGLVAFGLYSFARARYARM